MSIRKILIGGTSVVAILFAWQTIQAVGSHVPVEERVWVPPTVAAGMDDEMMFAAHAGPAAVPPFDILAEADGVTAPARPSVATVDLSALRYFAEAGDEAAMAREIARLEARHQGFVVPDALRRPRNGMDEAGLWSLLGDGRTGEIRARIAILEATVPGYEPSPDLLAAVNAAEARTAVAAALAAGNHGDAIAAAAAAPHGLRCDDPEHLWRVAEAFAGAGESDRALAVHAYVLTHCADDGVRRGSVARGVAVSPEGARAVLIPAMEAAGRDADELGAARRAVLRGLVAAGLGAIADAPQEGCEPASPEVAGQTEAARRDADEAAVELARLAEDENDATVLGWHAYAAGRFEEAQRWFEEATGFSERLDVVAGTILSLKARGERREALAAAREREDDDRLACIALGIAAEDLAEGLVDHSAEVERLAMRLASADAAQVIGWHHLDAGRARVAHEWFSRSLSWRPGEAAARGLVVSAERMGDPARAREAARRWGREFPQVAEAAAALARASVPVPAAHPIRLAAAPAGAPMPLLPDPATILMDDALAAFRAGDHALAVEKLETRRRLHGEPRDVAMLRGWALHHAGELREAWNLFRALDEAHSTRETREAMLHTWRTMMPRRFH